MLISALVILCSVLVTYLGVSSCFIARRALKILDLYDEHMLARAREHKSHTKLHALLLRSEVKNDLLWPKSIIQKVRVVYAWLNQ
jgi:hypothetical protein